MTDTEVQGIHTSASEPAGEPALRYPGPAKLFVIWTVVGVLSSLKVQFQRMPSVEVGQIAAMLAFCACYYPWIVLSPLVFRLEKRLPLGGARWTRNLGILALVSVPFCVLVSPLMVILFFEGLAIGGAPRWNWSLQRSWLGHFPFAEVVFWSSVAGGYFIRTLNQLRAQEQKAARLALEKSRLEAGLRQAQLDVLRARLNPHFLFNSLQNISAMTKQDPQTASRMLTRLGDLLRAVLRHDSGPEHVLCEEIDLARAYVALEQMRFGDRLEVNFNIDPDVQAALVPCFVLQPIIENAVIHGLRGVRKPGVIIVKAAREGSDLAMTITDNGVGLPDEHMAKLKIGIGVGSTLERLGAMFPDQHAFTMRRPAEGGTEVRIAIPLRFGGSEGGNSRDEHPATADRR